MSKLISPNLAIPRLLKFWCWPWSELLALRHTINAGIRAILSVIFYMYKNLNFLKVNIITWTFYNRFESQKSSSFLVYTPNQGIQSWFCTIFCANFGHFEHSAICCPQKKVRKTTKYAYFFVKIKGVENWWELRGILNKILNLYMKKWKGQTAIHVCMYLLCAKQKPN